MKKIYFLLITALTTVGAIAQTTNLDLETWTTNGTYDSPDGWESVNQFATILGISPPVEKITTGAAQGFFSAKMTTLACPNCSLIGNLPDTLAGFIRQQVAFTQVPQTVTFQYDYQTQLPDLGLVYIEVTSWDAANDTALVITSASDTISVTSGWMTKTLNFTPDNSSLTPDSLKITFVSSAYAAIGSVIPNIPTTKVGSALSIDAIYLDTQVGVTENDVVEFTTTVINSKLTVNTNTQNGTIELVDLTGKVLLNEVINSDYNTFDLANLPSGIYLVRLVTSKGSKTNKVVIK